jgi:hypothetical protein
MSIKQAFISGVKTAGQAQLADYHNNFNKWSGINLSSGVGSDDKSEIGVYSDGGYPWVSACINAKIMDISNAELYFIDRKGEKVELDKLPDEIKNPIKAGYAGNSFSDMLAIAGAREDLSGNDLWIKDSEGSRYDQLLQIPSRFIVVNGGCWKLKKSFDEKSIEYFEVSYGGFRQVYNPDQVINFKRNAIIDPFIGVGLIAQARSVVNNEKVATEYHNNFLIKDGTPNMVYVDKEISDAREAQVKANNLRDMYAKGAYKNGLMYAYGDVSVQPFNISASDMEFVNSKKLNREVLISIMESTPSILGLEGESGNRAISLTATANYYRKVNSRLWHLTQIMNDQWLRMIDKKGEYTLTYSPYPTGNIEEVSIAVEKGMLTRNQANLIMGYEGDAKDKAMNTRFISRALAPIDQVAEGLSMGLLADNVPNYKHEVY